MIADINYVREVGNFPEALEEKVILPHLRAASSRLKKWVGTAVYSAAALEAEDAGDPRDFTDENLADPTKDLALAEAYLAISIGFVSFNTVINQSDSSAAGVTTKGTFGENEYSYVNPAHYQRIQDDFLNKAWRMAERYLDTDYGGGSPGPGISHALDRAGVEIDEDYPDS